MINGIDYDDWAGTAVSPAGDVNDDGIDDLIVGAEQAGSGASYVILGRRNLGAGGVIDLADLDGTNGFTINGPHTGSRFGCSVSVAGDVNADGIDDLIVGAYKASANLQPSAGASYVIFGRRSIGADGVIAVQETNRAIPCRRPVTLMAMAPMISSSARPEPTSASNYRWVRAMSCSEERGSVPAAP